MKWPATTLLEVTQFVRNGRSIKQSDILGGIPISRIETISDGNINPDKVGYAGIKPDELHDWHLKEGDILFSHINSESHLGKCAIYEGYPKPLLHGMNLLCIRPDQSVVVPRFLHYALRSPIVRSQLPGITKRAINQASISGGNLKCVWLPLPPLSEQRHIVEVLDQADALRRKRAEADARAARILPALFYQMFGDPVTNPMGWPVVKLEDAVSLINGRAFKSSEWDSVGLPIIRIQNLKDESAPFNYYNGRYDQGHFVETGDLLLSWSGQLVSFGVYVWDRPEGVLNQHIFKVAPRMEFKTLFLQHVLSGIVEQAKENFHGIEIKHLTKSSLNRYKLIYPPVDLQALFAERALKFSGLRKHEIATGSQLDTLFQSLLHSAFSGD